MSSRRRTPFRDEKRLLLREQLFDLLLKARVLVEDALFDAALHRRLYLALARDVFFIRESRGTVGKAETGRSG
jgi:hypothetical protein